MSVINTNITSMIGQSNLQKSQSALQTSMERLSSGLRINSAKDDAAGQAIANRMSSQITGLAQAQRNANDGISVAQTAEGALNQINDNLQRIRELAVQAENGTNSAEDRQSIQNEIDQRLNEINRISDETNFNGTKVLQSDNNMRIQVGANDGEVISIGLKEINVKTLGLEGFNVTGKGEIANAAASRNDLVLAGFQAQGTSNGVERFTNVLQNVEAKASNVLGSVTNGSVVSFSGTNTGFNVAATDGYTFNAATNSYSFDAAGVDMADALSHLVPSKAGETTELTITIQGAPNGGTQNVIVDSEGNLTAKESGAVLYLTADGNLTQTNSSGSLQQAKLENVLESMGSQGVAAPTAPSISESFGDGTNAATLEVGFSALTAGQSITLDGVTLTASGAMTDADVAAAFFAKLQNTGIEGVANGAFTGSFDTLDFSNIDTASGVSGATMTLVSNSDTTDGTAEFGGPNGIVAEVAGQDAGTGGTIKMGDTVFTADTSSGNLNVTNATIGADQLAKQMQGSAFTVNVDGNQYEIAANGSVSRELQAIESTGTANYGDGTNAAIVSLTFGNMQAGDAYEIDGVTFTANQSLTGEQVANAFAAALGGNFDSALGDFGTSPAFDNMADPADFTTQVVDGTLTITTTGNNDGAAFGGVAVAVNATVNSDATNVYINADGGFVTDATSTIERFVQENGNVTDSSARQVFVDQQGELTFKSVTESERSKLGDLDDALSQVDALRSDLGAIQNRLESAIDNLGTTQTNLSAARSRIEDADYAVEVANMTRAQILQQAGTSVLAQANQIPQNVLSLLG
ncbi:flagellin N-terminal helical domain-containing protein [Billgrantia desiderata]|uniref:flagellin N-terminal helical domain-containing protein n=1 Tax=Billgrantia desiderata TaxID=52021 RepID=UPI003F335D69